jgi:DNA (cytosine-5)-methyltransferase 1
MRPRALDLFCGAGGASMGLHRAGFDVLGVDIENQPEHPFDFVRGDAVATLDLLASGSLARATSGLGRFDLVWASPPCQAFTAYRRRVGHVAPRPNLIPIVREKLRAAGIPYIIENVVGAPLESPVMLCGSMFGLEVQRHRIFETSFPMLAPECKHDVWVPRFPPATNRKNLRKTVEVGVWRIPLSIQQRAMGIDWMSLEKLSQAIPPAYAEWLGRAAMRVVRDAA